MVTIYKEKTKGVGVSELVTDKVTDRVTDEVPDKVPNDVPDQLTENQLAIVKLIKQNPNIFMSLWQLRQA